MSSGLLKIYGICPSFIKDIWRMYKKRKYSCYTDSDIGFLEDGGYFKHLGEIHGGYSQNGQDIFLKNIFQNKKNGYFLDIGGNHPFKYNNTYYFEKNGWKGLAIEPQSDLCVLWEKRNTRCMQVVAGDEEKEVMFVEDGEDKCLSHVSDSGGYYVRQRCIKNILRENNVNHVDFVSLDVEGYELPVLSGIDFSECDISVFLIENSDTDYKRAKRVRQFLHKKGYILAARIVGDDVWIKKVL